MIETACDDKNFVSADNKSSSNQRTGPVRNVETWWPSLESYFTPGTYEMPANNGNFHLDRDVYDAMISS